MSAGTQPPVPRVATTARPPATTAPASGTKLPKNTNTASGPASGVPRRTSATPITTAWMAAIATVPRTYPVIASHAACPAESTRVR